MDRVRLNGGDPATSAAQAAGTAPSGPAAAFPAQYAEAAGAEWHAGRWVGGRSQWANSFSDVSSVIADDSLLNTPAQLRPLDSWVPQTPAEGADPPPYQEHVAWLPPPSACASSLLEPVQLAKLFKQSTGRCSGSRFRAGGQEGTQPTGSGIPEGADYFLEGGVELTPCGRIPTPSRSQRHVAVQANRRSIDGHAGAPASPPSAQQPAGASRSRLASIIRSNGAPEEEGTLSAPATARCDIRSLQYPKVAAGPGAAADERQPGSWEGRVALSEALSEAVTDEFEELQRAWSLGAADGDPRVENVAKTLRKVAARAERACVVEALQPWAAAEGPTGAEVADEEERLRELEAEISVVDERLDSMREAQADISQVKEAAPCETISRLVAQLSVLESNVASMAAVGAQELHECLQQLGCVEGWFERAFNHLEEAERDLTEREYEASQRAFTQFPGEALDPQRELLRLR